MANYGPYRSSLVKFLDEMMQKGLLENEVRDGKSYYKKKEAKESKEES